MVKFKGCLRLQKPNYDKEDIVTRIVAHGGVAFKKGNTEVALIAMSTIEGRTSIVGVVDSRCVYMYMNARKPDLNDIRYMVNEFMQKHFNDTLDVKDITHLTSITGTLTLENLD